MSARTTDFVYYRCKKCGTVEAAHQIEPGDEGPPQKECPCEMGAKWQKGIWVSIEVPANLPKGNWR